MMFLQQGKYKSTFFNVSQRNGTLNDVDRESVLKVFYIVLDAMTEAGPLTRQSPHGPSHSQVVPGLYPPL